MNFAKTIIAFLATANAVTMQSELDSEIINIGSALTSGFGGLIPTTTIREPAREPA